MDVDKILGIVRHVVGGLGAALVGFGLASSADVATAATSVDSIVGGALFLVGLVASIVAKIKGKNAAAKTDEAAK